MSAQPDLLLGHPQLLHSPNAHTVFPSRRGGKKAKKPILEVGLSHSLAGKSPNVIVTGKNRQKYALGALCMFYYEGFTIK